MGECRMRLIRSDEVEILKNIILDQHIYIEKGFQIVNKQLGCEITYDDLSYPQQVKQGEYQFNLIKGNQNYTVNYKGIEGIIGFDLWETNDKGIRPVLNLGLTIMLNSGEYIFGEHFYQINLFEALVDNNMVYVVRDIGKYEGVYYKRRMICFDDKKYIEVIKINFKELQDEESKDSILRDLIYNFLECALLNQQLIEEEN